MPPRSDNRPIAVRLTAAEEAMIHRERERRGAPSLSTVLDQAVLALLERSDIRREGLRVPSRDSGKLVPRRYMLGPRTIRLVREAAARHGFTIEEILRAAIAELARESMRDADGPGG
jgi:hypothetical protein